MKLAAALVCLIAAAPAQAHGGLLKKEWLLLMPNPNALPDLRDGTCFCVGYTWHFSSAPLIVKAKIALHRRRP